MLAGVDNFYDALEDMLGYRPNPWMKWSWTVITPLLCVVRGGRGAALRRDPPPGVCRRFSADASRPLQGCFVFSLVKYKPLTYNKVYEYPDWAVALGWTLALASMICIPMVVVIKIIRSDGPLIEVGGATLVGSVSSSLSTHSPACCLQRIKAVAAPVRGGASSRPKDHRGPKELTYPLDPNGNGGRLKAPSHIIVETMM